MSAGLSSEEVARAKGLLGRINEGDFYSARVKVVQVLKPKTAPALRCKLIANFPMPGRTVIAGTFIEVGPEMFTPNQRWKPLAAELSSEVHLPNFRQAEAARDAGKATPLEMFIYEYCPGTKSEEARFFIGLKAMIEFCIGERLKG